MLKDAVILASVGSNKSRIVVEDVMLTLIIFGFNLTIGGLAS